jgi:hypothetical protein
MISAVRKVLHIDKNIPFEEIDARGTYINT